MDGRKRRKLFALCVLGTLFFMMASIVPSFAPVVPVDASSATITITKVTPTELQPGDTKEVAVTMKNNGAWDAKDITLSFQGSETISFIGPTSVHVNTVNSWKSKTGVITVHVKEEAPNGAYTIPITCTWRGIHFDPNVGYDVTTDLMEANLGITFNVVGHGLINIGDVTSDPTDIKPGHNHVKLSVYIENSGEAAVKDVTSNLNCPKGFNPSWSGTDRSYLGRLNSGDSKEAIFHIDVAKTIDAGPLIFTYVSSQ